MTTKRLTKDDALLLHRHVDGECTPGEQEVAEALLEQSSAARVYVSALEALGDAVRGAEEKAWERAHLPSPHKWVELAEASSEISDTSLDELAPMLERFHDGEVDDTEAAVVAALIDERDDVAQYLAELQGLADGVRQVGQFEDVDFDGFWDGIAEAIDDTDARSASGPVAVEPFELDAHRDLLRRYHDNEATAAQRRQVEAWIEAGNDEVDQYLGALAEVHIGVNAGMEVACEKADFDQLWDGIGDHLDAIDAERAADNVVSLQSGAEQEASVSTQSRWKNPVVALAAAVALLVTGSLLGSQLWQADEDLGEPQTIVIFDSIESAPGSSVFLHAPQLADHEVGPDGAPTQPGIRAEDDDADPTVLWVIDEEDDDDDDDDDDELPGPI